ncbi:MAG: hypothetical protein FRX49_07070 [Trebouxia sp. A1-2]|nr:MAG: hypothetical protein FRX49_07070 [Trebouxia sp. A1-2]
MKKPGGECPGVEAGVHQCSSLLLPQLLFSSLLLILFFTGHRGSKGPLGLTPGASPGGTRRPRGSKAAPSHAANIAAAATAARASSWSHRALGGTCSKSWKTRSASFSAFMRGSCALAALPAVAGLPDQQRICRRRLGEVQVLGGRGYRRGQALALPPVLTCQITCISSKVPFRHDEQATCLIQALLMPPDGIESRELNKQTVTTWKPWWDRHSAKKISGKNEATGHSSALTNRVDMAGKRAPGSIICPVFWPQRQRERSMDTVTRQATSALPCADEEVAAGEAAARQA